jgi:hypothetical protein
MTLEDKLRPTGSLKHWVAHRLSVVEGEVGDDLLLPSEVSNMSRVWESTRRVAETLQELTRRNLVEPEVHPDNADLVVYRPTSQMGFALSNLPTPEVPDIIENAKAFEAASNEGFVEAGSHNGSPVFADPDEEADNEYIWADDSFVKLSVSLEPNWEWLGVQLTKLGFHESAKQAFNADLSPGEVYGQWLSVINQARRDPSCDVDLDLTGDGHETPVSDDLVAACKRHIGYTEDNDSDSNE